MDAAAIPLPSDETTPPVMNMYLAITRSSPLPELEIMIRPAGRLFPHLPACPPQSTRSPSPPRGSGTRFRWPAIAPAVRPVRADPPAARDTPVRNCAGTRKGRSEEHTSELQSLRHLVCRL